MNIRALCGWLPSIAACAAVAGSTAPAQDPTKPSVVQHEKDIAVVQPGPHDGGGTTTAYPFFADAPGMGWIFRKRVLHPGAAIGLHPHDKDEIYYVLGGTGELTLDGRKYQVGPGTAILTRIGSTHALRQTGKEDLEIIVSYLGK
jgi:mannose-6-phosphate isomerase-like protein (cupin superfamily)